MAPALPTSTDPASGVDSRPVATLVVQGDVSAMGCPDASEIARRVDQRLGAGAILPGTGEAPTHASLLLFRRGTARHARVVTTGARPGSRDLSDEEASCAGLAEAVALTLALVLDPTAPFEAEVPALPSRRRTWVELGPFLSHGVLPGLSAGAGLGVASELGSHWMIRLGSAFWPAKEQDFEAGSVTVRLLTGDARVCRTHVLFGTGSTPDLSACVFVAAGALRGEARGFRSSRAATSPWVSTGLGLRFGGNLVGPLDWALWADAATPLADESFSVEGLGIVYRPSRVHVSEGLSLGIRLF